MRMLKVDDETYSRVCELAESQHVSRSDFIHSVIDARIEHEKYLRREIRKGLEQIEKGEVVSQEDMKQFMQDLIDDY